MEKQLNTRTLNSERPKRVPIAGRSRLAIRNRDPNYHYRIVNVNLESDPDRVSNLIEQGYEIVENPGKVGDNQVDNPSALGSASQISVGQGTKAIVMRIRKDWFQEDQALKQLEVDKTEQHADKRADYGSMTVEVTKGSK